MTHGFSPFARYGSAITHLSTTSEYTVAATRMMVVVIDNASWNIIGHLRFPKHGSATIALCTPSHCLPVTVTTTPNPRPMSGKTTHYVVSNVLATRHPRGVAVLLTRVVGAAAAAAAQVVFYKIKKGWLGRGSADVASCPFIKPTWRHDMSSQVTGELVYSGRDTQRLIVPQTNVPCHSPATIGGGGYFWNRAFNHAEVLTCKGASATAAASSRLARRLCGTQIWHMHSVAATALTVVIAGREEACVWLMDDRTAASPSLAPAVRLKPPLRHVAPASVKITGVSATECEVAIATSLGGVFVLSLRCVGVWGHTRECKQ